MTESALSCPGANSQEHICGLFEIRMPSPAPLGPWAVMETLSTANAEVPATEPERVLLWGVTFGAVLPLHPARATNKLKMIVRVRAETPITVAPRGHCQGVHP